MQNYASVDCCPGNANRICNLHLMVSSSVVYVYKVQWHVLQPWPLRYTKAVIGHVTAIYKYEAYCMT